MVRRASGSPLLLAVEVEDGEERLLRHLDAADLLHPLLALLLLLEQLSLAGDVAAVALREPIAAWMGTSNICRGISSRSRSTSSLPRSYAASRWAISDSASTCSPPTRTSTRASSPSRNPAMS